MKRLSALGAMKLSAYVLRNIPEENYILWANLLCEDIPNEEILRLEDELYFTMHEEEYSEPLFKIVEECGDNELAHTILQLASLRYINPEYGALIDLVSQNIISPDLSKMGTGKGVSILTAVRVNEEILQDDSGEEIAVIEDATNRLWLLLLPYSRGDLLDTVFYFDSTLLAFSQGDTILDRELTEDCRLISSNETALFGYEEAASRLSKDVSNILEGFSIDDNQFLRVIIEGEQGSGKKSHVMYIENALERKVLVTNYSFVVSTGAGENDIGKRLRRILRACRLFEMDLCISDISQDDNTRLFVSKIQENYGKYVGEGCLYLLADTDAKLPALMNGCYISYKVSKPNGNISLRLWEGLLRKADITGVDADELSSILTLNPGQLVRVVEYMACHRKTEKMTVSDIYKICYQVLDDGRYENVHRVEPGYSMADIKLDGNKMEVLRDICNQITNRRKVYEDWGMSKKYAYGRCVSILLAGPPGTGKTMAVHAIAKELGLEMYKVDLSQVVDKYIGETEKRLEEVFCKAEKSNMILFFDEADSIMGKRGDGGDNVGKSYNTQIAFILQRIEEYDGIVVLATNLISNIDNAFMRRIRYVLQFDYPSSEIRKEIWKNAFSENVPQDSDIDFDYLSDTFEISGAIIKNIVLNSTFMAAAEDRAVAMEHICKAIMRESAKDRGIISGTNLGRYEYLFRN